MKSGDNGEEDPPVPIRWCPDPPGDVFTQKPLPVRDWWSIVWTFAFAFTVHHRYTLKTEHCFLFLQSQSGTH